MIANLPDYYRILGVLDSASPRELKASYRQLVQGLHPDRNQSPGAADQLQLVLEAYAVLADPTRRQQYDAAILARERPPSADKLPATRPGVVEGVTRLLGGLVGELGRRWTLGQDLRYTLELDLAQACLGSDREVRFEAPVRCPGCRGRGKLGLVAGETCQACSGEGVQLGERVFQVSLPPGTGDGQLVRIPGGGTPGERGGPEGDLTFVVRVAAHPLLEREDRNLRCRVPVPITTALAGGRVQVPTLEGVTLVRVPMGVQAGQILRLEGRGVPLPGGRGRGDLLITLEVETPTRLSAPARRLLVEAEQACPPESFPMTSSYRKRLEALDPKHG